MDRGVGKELARAALARSLCGLARRMHTICERDASTQLFRNVSSEIYSFTLTSFSCS